ncbi:hypothetical protein ACHAQH_004392 [Verticillium albo-atrum]
MGGDGGGVEEWHKRKDYLTNNGSIIEDDRRQDHDSSVHAEAPALGHRSTSFEGLQGPESNMVTDAASRMQRSSRATDSAINGLLSQTPGSSIAGARGEFDKEGGQQATGQPLHPGSPAHYGSLPTEDHPTLDAELIADMEGKPFGFGYLDHGVFVGEFAAFSPNGWEISAEPDDVSRLLFPLTADDAPDSRDLNLG